MAARTRKIRHDDNTRAKIKASQLINRLQDHFLGKVELSATQANVGLGLLRKILPDLAATELSGEVARTTVIRAPETVADSRTWLEKHAPGRDDAEPKPDQVN